STVSGDGIPRKLPPPVVSRPGRQCGGSHGRIPIWIRDLFLTVKMLFDGFRRPIVTNLFGRRRHDLIHVHFRLISSTTIGVPHPWRTLGTPQLTLNPFAEVP